MACLVSLSKEMVERRLHFPPLQIRTWVVMHLRSVTKQKGPFLSRAHSAPSMKIARLVDDAINFARHLLSLSCKARTSHHKVERVFNLRSCAALAQTLRARDKGSRVSPNLDLELTRTTSQFRLHAPSVAHRPGASLLQISWHVIHR